MNTNNVITPEVEAILAQCRDSAEKVRVAQRLEAIAAAIRERVLREQEQYSPAARFYRN